MYSVQIKCLAWYMLVIIQQVLSKGWSKVSFKSSAVKLYWRKDFLRVSLVCTVERPSV